MRCQTVGCPTTTIREDRLHAAIGRQLLNVSLGEADQKCLEHKMQIWLGKRTKAADQKALNFQVANVKERQDQLTDALLDGLIDKPVFLERKERLAKEERRLIDALAKIGKIEGDARLAENFLELAKNVYLTYQMADQHQKRRLTEILFSNRSLKGKQLYLEPQKWLQDKEWTLNVLCGGPHQATSREKEEIVRALNALASHTLSSDSGAAIE